MAKLCPWGTEVQTLLFNKYLFSKGSAKRWAIRNGFKSSGLVEEKGYFHIRQVSPDKFRKSSFRTITLKNSAVRAVVGCPR